MTNFEVYHGSEKIVSLTGDELWVLDDQGADCRLVMALFSLGIPQERNTPDRLDFWRTQAEDPDFVDRLTEHLMQYGLEVRSAPKREE